MRSRKSNFRGNGRTIGGRLNQYRTPGHPLMDDLPNNDFPIFIDNNDLPNPELKNSQINNDLQKALEASFYEQKLKSKDPFEEYLELSKKEYEINNQVRDEILNQKGLLVSILNKLKGVNPNDPIFAEFFSNQDK